VKEGFQLTGKWKIRSLGKTRTTFL